MRNINAIVREVSGFHFLDFIFSSVKKVDPEVQLSKRRFFSFSSKTKIRFSEVFPPGYESWIMLIPLRFDGNNTKSCFIKRVSIFKNKLWMPGKFQKMPLHKVVRSRLPSQFQFSGFYVSIKTVRNPAMLS